MKWINVIVSDDIWLELKQYSAELNTSIARLTGVILCKSLEQGDIVEDLYTRDMAKQYPLKAKGVCNDCLKILYKTIGGYLKEEIDHDI